jgi:hypothetical protein
MGRSGHGLRMGGAVVFVAVALVAAACSGDDDGGSNAASDSGADAGASPDGTSSRCDLGFNTDAFNDSTELQHHQAHDHMEMGQVDFTLAQWADVFANPDVGMTPQKVLDGLADNDIYSRHVLAGVLTHRLGPDPWIAMTDPAQCDLLSGELDRAREAAARFPTVADALAAGYDQGDVYYAGLGVHYQHWGLLGDFDPGRPVQLLYDGTDPASTLVGLSYVVTLEGDVAPEGFTGDNDQWHRHDSWCLDQAHGSLNLAADVLSPEECAALGGTHMPNTSAWMLHVWVVPGCGSDWGIFSSANPRLPYIPPSARLVSGCTAGSDVSLASSG